eukprot:7194189-Alexandrium_andersonii.AAC.1
MLCAGCCKRCVGVAYRFAHPHPASPSRSACALPPLSEMNFDWDESTHQAQVDKRWIRNRVKSMTQSRTTGRVLAAASGSPSSSSKRKFLSLIHI